MAYILIADDDELIAQLACETLIDAGHACGFVTSAEEAWTLLERRPPDLMLLDQDMPGMSGVSLLRRIRGSSRFYDLSVIMFTAMSGAEDENRAMYAGAQDYIRKPFKPKGLVDRVERELARRDPDGHVDLRTRLARDAGLLGETFRRDRRMVF